MSNKTTNNIEETVQYFTNSFECLNMFSVPLNVEAYGFFTRDEFIEEINKPINDNTTYVFRVRVSPQGYKNMHEATEVNLITSLRGIANTIDDDRVMAVSIEENFVEYERRYNGTHPKNKMLISVDMFFEINFDLYKEMKKNFK